MQTAYHSPLRQAQAAGTRERILEACGALLQRGEDLTYGAVAVEAGVQERTVYRHFATKAALESGLWTWITEHLTQADFSARTADALVSSMRRSFRGFDAGAPLILAMLRSRQGTAIRLRQQEARRAMFEGCVEAAAPDLPPSRRSRAAAALQVLYSAPSWELLRTFWGMDADRAADTIELGIRALLAGVRAEATGTDRRTKGRTS